MTSLFGVLRMKYNLFFSNPKNSFKIFFYDDSYDISNMSLNYDQRGYLFDTPLLLDSLEINFVDESTYHLDYMSEEEVSDINNPVNDERKNKIKSSVFRGLGQFLTDIIKCDGHSCYPKFNENKCDVIEYNKLGGKEVNLIGEAMVMIAKW
ncbi:hypothetical protein [Tunicatimonas pelagia]|uniref:hypothetical protein n=1 Tax=Tunicatimonas pelagia TaxID=931531 RepID=UPI002665A2DA|nr:hypothetical protein [Tunicatimonas pelagia]WKN45419.1 hypothetical protein P0M28_10665 [Tunicatimonas pelagia]